MSIRQWLASIAAGAPLLAAAPVAGHQHGDPSLPERVIDAVGNTGRGIYRPAYLSQVPGRNAHH